LGQVRSARSQLIDTLLWVATLVLLALSFLLSWGQPPRFGPRFELDDKLWHLLGYGALCLTLLMAAVWRPGRGEGSFPRAARAAALLVLGIAWITEALQAPFGRDAELLDAVADLGGIVAGFVAWRMLARSRPVHRVSTPGPNDS
jgi:VanZ family protein